MKIAAVSTVLNEADIIGDTLAHLFNNGVANIYIADGHSTDGTRDIYSQFPVKVFDQTEDYHAQPKWITHLAQVAYEDGADWVIPFDADEFWCAHDPKHPDDPATLAEMLARAPADVTKVYARMYQYVDFECREPEPKPLPKVAFRTSNGVKVANGNHDAIRGGRKGYGALRICEIQYRSFEHFCRKIIERNATIDPKLGPGEGFHHKRYAGWTSDELRPVWDEMVAKANVHDPIPVRR